jgi:hypothetical protein
MKFDHDLLGRVYGYAVIDIVGTIAIGYLLASRLQTPMVPTIAATFLAGEVVHWAMGINTPLLEQAGVTFFPAPAAGRHLNKRACNCH